MQGGEGWRCGARGSRPTSRQAGAGRRGGGVARAAQRVLAHGQAAPGRTCAPATSPESAKAGRLSASSSTSAAALGLRGKAGGRVWGRAGRRLGCRAVQALLHEQLGAAGCSSPGHAWPRPQERRRPRRSHPAPCQHPHTAAAAGRQAGRPPSARQGNAPAPAAPAHAPATHPRPLAMSSSAPTIKSPSVAAPSCSSAAPVSASTPRIDCASGCSGPGLLMVTPGMTCGGGAWQGGAGAVSPERAGAGRPASGLLQPARRAALPLRRQPGCLPAAPAQWLLCGPEQWPLCWPR